MTGKGPSKIPLGATSGNTFAVILDVDPIHGVFWRELVYQAANVRKTLAGRAEFIRVVLLTQNDGLRSIEQESAAHFELSLNRAKRAVQQAKGLFVPCHEGIALGIQYYYGNPELCALTALAFSNKHILSQRQEQFKMNHRNFDDIATTKLARIFSALSKK